MHQALKFFGQYAQHHILGIYLDAQHCDAGRWTLGFFRRPHSRMSASAARCTCVGTRGPYYDEVVYIMEDVRAILQTLTHDPLQCAEKIRGAEQSPNGRRVSMVRVDIPASQAQMKAL